jgi:uncharacterized protein YmfQ (DUF2313 family)
MTCVKEQIAKILKRYVVNGFLSEALNISSTYIFKMFAGFSGTFKRECDSEDYLRRELNPETTFDLIGDWERFVGIPDECFSNKNLSIEQRRNQVITKLTAQVQTDQDFVDLAAKLGVEVTVSPKVTGDGGFPLTLPYTLVGTDDYFIIVVNIIGWAPTGGFPLTLPYTLGAVPYTSQIQCLFDKLKPANCAIEYI